MDKKKILVIDDEKDFTKLVKLNLEQTGDYEVMIENEGTSALNTIRQFKPDLILLDIVMPDANGGEIAQEIRLDEGLKSIPVVFLTAIVTKEEVASQGGKMGGRSGGARRSP